jgi:hypothetical protein
LKPGLLLVKFHTPKLKVVSHVLVGFCLEGKLFERLKTFGESRSEGEKKVKSVI